MTNAGQRQRGGGRFDCHERIHRVLQRVVPLRDDVRTLRHVLDILAIFSACLVHYDGISLIIS